MQQIRPHRFLVVGIAVSFLLHLVCAYLLVALPGGSTSPPPAVSYVELSAPRRPAPMALPPKDAPAPKVAEKPVPPVEVPPPQVLPQAPPSAATQPPPAVPQETKPEEERSHTVLGLGLTKGYFKGLGDGETLRQGVREYYGEMLQGINEKWWIDQKLDKRRLVPVVVSITLARNGAIVGTRILRGSGDLRYDKAVLAALAAASPLPPLPQSYDQEFFEAPIRLVPPLDLMAW